MENIYHMIAENINTYVYAFITQITNEYEINEEVLHEMWEKVANEKLFDYEGEEKPAKKSKKSSKAKKEESEDEEEEPVKKPSKAKKAEDVPKPKSKSKKTVEESEDDEEEEEDEPKPKSKSKGDGTCIHKFTKGEKAGEKCGAKIKEGDYCGKHVKKVESPKSVKSDKSEKSEKSKSSSPKEVCKSIVIRKLADHEGKYWHPDTTMVFESATEKKVIGKLKNKKIVELTADDIEECKRWGFVFEKKSSPSKKTSPSKKLKPSSKKPIEDSDEEEEDDNEISKLTKKFNALKTKEKIPPKNDEDEEGELEDVLEDAFEDELEEDE